MKKGVKAFVLLITGTILWFTVMMFARDKINLFVSPFFYVGLALGVWLMFLKTTIYNGVKEEKEEEKK